MRRLRLRALGGACLLLLCCFSLGCRSTERIWPESERSQTRSGKSHTEIFSGRSAWHHMRSLNAIGNRVTGTPGSEAARAYMREALERDGVATRALRVVKTLDEGQDIEFTHLLGVVPGQSNDVMLLAAHYDSPRNAPETRGGNDQRASGSALLLELARALRAGPSPAYTIWLIWIDGDAFVGDGSVLHLGTQSLADAWARSGELANVRVAMFFGNVGDRDRPIVRDIDSPRVYREIFWEAARDLGLAETFPMDSRYGEPQTGRSTFAQSTGRSSLAIANERDALREPQLRQSADRTVRRVSAGLEAVGRVTLEALARTAFKLRKVDRFAQSPLTAGRETEAATALAE